MKNFGVDLLASIMFIGMMIFLFYALEIKISAIGSMVLVFGSFPLMVCSRELTAKWKARRDKKK